MEKKLVIIGGGPAGLAAALGAYSEGINPDDILIIERESELGGILNQCIHTGFGIEYFGKELTGPEYASVFIKRIKEAKIGYLTDSTVLSLNDKREVTFVSPDAGYCTVKAEAVILTMGCRERSAGALKIAGTRPAGIFSAGTAQRFVNIDGYLPGKNVVILGSGNIGLIMARRLTLEGAKVLKICEIMPYAGGLSRNVALCLDDFDIPLSLSHTVTKVIGKDRVEGVVVSKVEENGKVVKGTEEVIECDTLILSIGLIPENEITKEAGLKIDKNTSGAVVNNYNETTAEGIFACGNVLQVHDLVDYVTEESECAGKNAARYIMGTLPKPERRIKIVTSNGIKYAVPQFIDYSKGANDKVKICFRTKKAYSNATLKIIASGKEIISKKKDLVLPAKMQAFEILTSEFDELPSCEEIKVQVTEE